MTINSIINPIGKAAIIATDCKLYIEFSAKINAIGNKIKIIAIGLMFFFNNLDTTKVKTNANNPGNN